ncbi:MAG TPA: hypothetical protein V6D23_14430, partial [Candidatus Obscuribacterales bacterium]
MEAFRRQHGQTGEEIVVVVKDSHLPIAQMFSRHISRIATISDQTMDAMIGQLRGMNVRTGLEPDRAVFLHPHHLDDG